MQVETYDRKKVPKRRRIPPSRGTWKLGKERRGSHCYWSFRRGGRGRDARDRDERDRDGLLRRDALSLPCAPLRDASRPNASRRRPWRRSRGASRLHRAPTDDLRRRDASTNRDGGRGAANREGARS